MASNTSHNLSSSRSQISLVSSVLDVDNGAYNKPSSKLATLGRGWMPTPLLWICVQAPDEWTFLPAIYCFTCLTFGGRLWSMTGSPHQMVDALRQHIVAIILNFCFNPTTNLVSDSLCTPSGYTWPIPKGAGRQWSVVTLGHDQYASSVAYIYFIVQSRVHFHQSGHHGWCQHISKEREHLQRKNKNWPH